MTKAMAAAAAMALLAGCARNADPASAPSAAAAPLLTCAMSEVAALGYGVVLAPQNIEDGFAAEKDLPPAEEGARTRGVLLVSASRAKDGYRLEVEAQRYAEGPGTARTVGQPRSVPSGPIPLPASGPLTGPRVPGDPRGPATAGSWRRITSGRVGNDAARVRAACEDGVPDAAETREAPASPAAPGRQSRTAG